MRTERFNSIIEAAVDRSLSMLATKNDHYSGNAQYDEKSKAEDDRLRGSKSVAHIQGVNVFQALGGLMAKHTSSVYNLIRNTTDGEVAPLAVWQEKISDHINYLLLIEAAVYEQNDHIEEASEGQPDDLNAIDRPWAPGLAVK